MAISRSFFPASSASRSFERNLCFSISSPDIDAMIASMNLMLPTSTSFHFARLSRTFMRRLSRKNPSAFAGVVC